MLYNIMAKRSYRRHNGICTIKLLVTLKTKMPKGDSLYITGNLLELGDWEPTGKQLHLCEDGTYSIEFNARKGTIIECKLTRGTWKSQGIYINNGKPPDNYVIKADKDKIVKVSILDWLDKRVMVSDPVKGKLLAFDRFTCKGLKYKRGIEVWLPETYSDAHQPYSVIYTHDGQNLFEPGNAFAGMDWKVDETVTKLLNEGKIKNCIVVGIPNSPDRMKELNLETTLGKSYAQFIIEEVMPFVETKFNVSRNFSDSFIMGSSMGGLMAFQMGFTFPHKFGGAACLSSAFQSKFSKIIEQVKHSDHLPQGLRVYIDTGEYEKEINEREDICECYYKMMEILVKRGFKEGENLMGYFDEKATHTESAWAMRLKIPLMFLLGKIK